MMREFCFAHGGFLCQLEWRASLENGQAAWFWCSAGHYVEVTKSDESPARMSLAALVGMFALALPLLAGCAPMMQN